MENSTYNTDTFGVKIVHMTDGDCNGKNCGNVYRLFT